MSKVTSYQIKEALARKHEDREFFITECKNGPTGVARGQLLIFDAIAIYKSWKMLSCDLMQLLKRLMRLGSRR